MDDFETKKLPEKRDGVAPDGFDVKILLNATRGGLAYFEFAANKTSKARAHHNVEEIWYFLTGQGKIWRKLNDHEEIIPIEPGMCITIPTGTHFQLHSIGPEPLSAIGITMPNWLGPEEWYEVQGKW